MIDYAWCKFAKPKDQNKTSKVENVSTKVKPVVAKKETTKKSLKAKTPLKKSNKPIKGKKKTRTKAVDISTKVRKIVLERDKGICVICGKAGIPNCHYKRRSQGGLGIEQNVVCACIKCHTAYDNGDKLKEYGKIIKEYLKGKYENWNEKDLIYRKGV